MINKGVVAVWEGDYKLVYSLQDNKALLFNLKKDPDEQSNIIDLHPQMAHRLSSVIQENIDKANRQKIY